MNMELDFTNGRIGNVDGRATLFKSIIDRDWNLTLYSQVCNHDEKIIFNNDYKNEYGINNKWISSINYRPDKLVHPKTDLLIIENGPDNWLFKTKYKQQPFIRRCAEVMNSYSGDVFILGIHPDVPFPLDKMAYCKVQYNDKKNVYRNNSGSDPAHGWASYDEICKDKRLIFFNQAHNQERYLDFFDKKRQGFRKHNVEFHRLPVLYGRWLVPKNLRKLKRNPQYDFVYMGYPRGREKEFTKYIFPVAKKFNVDSWGPWDKKSNLKYKDEAINNSVNVHEFLPSQIMCVEKYNDSLISLGLISERLQECGWITHRTLETIHSGCILLGLKNAIGISEYLKKKYLISSPEEIIEWTEKLKSMSLKKRISVWEEQYNKIKKYNGEYMLNHIMKHYNKEEKK